jgi:hypothetical protein
MTATCDDMNLSEVQRASSISVGAQRITGKDRCTLISGRKSTAVKHSQLNHEGVQRKASRVTTAMSSTMTTTFVLVPSTINALLSLIDTAIPLPYVHARNLAICNLKIDRKPSLSSKQCDAANRT